MLRITVEVGQRVVTFRLEGSFTGPWLQELEDCWQRSLDCQHMRNRIVDLTEVTFIDATGKACLAAMHQQGAEFLAADCMTKAIVAEIKQPGSCCTNQKQNQTKGKQP
jgi:anti-anti-sigma regulatory factor